MMFFNVLLFFSQKVCLYYFSYVKKTNEVKILATATPTAYKTSKKCDFECYIVRQNTVSHT